MSIISGFQWIIIGVTVLVMLMTVLLGYFVINHHNDGNGLLCMDYGFIMIFLALELLISIVVLGLA